MDHHKMNIWGVCWQIPHDL